MHDFSFIYSCDLDKEFSIKIGTLEGTLERASYEDLLRDPLLEFSGRWTEQCSDMYVEVQVLSDCEPLTLPVSTSYKAFTTRWNWNEWLNLQIRYCDLPADATLRFDVFEPYAPQKVCHVGYTFVSVFTDDLRLNQGLHDLKLAVPAGEDAGRLRVISSDDAMRPGRATTNMTVSRQMDRLSMLTRQHRNGQLPQVDWLDRLTFREIEVINEREKRRSSSLYLMIEFATPTCLQREVNVVYFEKDADKEEPEVTPSKLMVVQDFEDGQDNLLELKHHHLARSLRSGVTDRHLKPDAVTRDQLAALISAPPTSSVGREAQDMFWKYRFYLSSQSKALSKFLKCVNWAQHSESQQALELMARWAPIEPHQALELLGPAFTHPAVRAYAVLRLQQAPDEELMLYLLQLVQALRYESEQCIFVGLLGLSPVQSRKFPLSSSSSTNNNNTDNILSRPDSPQAEVQERSGVAQSICRSPSPRRATIPHSASASCCLAPPSAAQPDLASFLIARACSNSVVANYLYWFLLMECEELDDDVKQDPRVRKIYLAVMRRFSMALSRGGDSCHVKRDVLSRQHLFIDKLVKLFKTVSKESGNRRKKIEKMQALLSDRDAFKFNFVSFEPMPLPLDPSIEICGVLPEKASLFKSALMPARLTFNTTSGGQYVAIFKFGDDLRQDQLVLQMITLMDRLLRRENLDLKLTPYKVLATSCKHGFVQYIESVAVAEVLAQEGSILNYFRRHHPCDAAPYGVAPDVMDTYIRSCAGYCVITYLLGVGDRHLDNLLLTPAGNLFHVDFGYILGRDPKPLPPPMKLSKEMVEAMGGVNSDHYQLFRKQCYTAFLHLREHAGVILHLFSLMVDANIPDIALEPDKSVRKVQDKFRLDLSDEEAVSYMQSMIDVSVTAVMAALVEQLHKFAQYWRK